MNQNGPTDDEIIYALHVGDGYFHLATRRLHCSRRFLSERIRTSERVAKAYHEALKHRRTSGRSRMRHLMLTGQIPTAMSLGEIGKQMFPQFSWD